MSGGGRRWPGKGAALVTLLTLYRESELVELDLRTLPAPLGNGHDEHYR